MQSDRDSPGTGLTIVGAGYVGLVTGAHLADMGRSVTLVEVDVRRRALIERGEAPIFEPGLSEVLRRVFDAGQLRVSGDLAAVLRTTSLVVVAVGTPALPDGRSDLAALNGVIATIAEYALPDTVVVIKSTVPPGTGRRIQATLDRAGRGIRVVNCPEFLREGCALEDIARAERFVVGGADPAALTQVIEVMNCTGAPVLRTSSTAAELIKYGSNAFLAMKISFINEMANLCDLLASDVDDVARGMSLDSRIGGSSMHPGLGFGGSCFPKDVAALEDAARREGISFWLLRSATDVNEQQRARFVQKIREACGASLGGRRVALLGLAFKPGTDDVRQAPSIAIAHRLLELGASVVAHDPVAVEAARGLLPEVEMAADPYAAMAGADVVALVTEWPEYRSIDWGRAAGLVRQAVVVDGRNCLDRDLVVANGFNYYGMGRPTIARRYDRRASDRESVEAAGSVLDQSA